MTEDEAFEADEKQRIAALHKTAPETIWLQIDPEAEQFDGWDAQTWCSDQLNETDLMYVRADLVEPLRQQLAAFHSAVEHVTEDGCTRRSVVAMPEGWAMVHKDRLHDLELAEEQLAATDDLSGYILCEKEPVIDSMYVGNTFQPLYRARKPKP